MSARVPCRCVSLDAGPKKTSAEDPKENFPRKVLLQVQVRSSGSCPQAERLQRASRASASKPASASQPRKLSEAASASKPRKLPRGQHPKGQHRGRHPARSDALDERRSMRAARYAGVPPSWAEGRVGCGLSRTGLCSECETAESVISNLAFLCRADAGK